MSGKAYYQKNRERILAHNRAYYLANKEKIKKTRKRYHAAYYSRNGEAVRARLLIEKRERRQRLLALFGSKCAHCGFTDWRALQIDHVNGGGSKERLIMRSNSAQFERFVMENIDNYQLLCANCNWIKRYERGEH